MSEQTMTVKVLADISDIKKGMSNVQKEIETTQTTAESASSALKSIGGAIAAAFTVGAVVGFGKQVVETTADLQAMDSQFSQVFKGSEGADALAAIDAQAQQLNIHTDRLTSSYNTFGSLLGSTGIEGADKIQATADATKIAADSAAWMNISMESATGSMNSFLKGNYEASDALGFTSSATQIAQYANDTYGVSFQDLTEDQKMLMRLNYAQTMMDNSGATGQATRESTSYENVMGNLDATWKRFQATIGAPILATTTTVVQGLTGAVEGANAIVESIKTNWDAWETPLSVIAVLVGALTAAIIAYNIAQNLTAICTAVSTVATTAFGAAVAFATSPVTLIILAIGALIAIGILLYKNWDTISAWLKSTWDKICKGAIAVWNSIKDFFVNLWNSITSKIQEVWNGIKDTISNVINGIKSTISNVFNGISSTISNVINGIKSTVTSVFNLIKAAMTNPVDTAKNLIKTAIDNIKSFFDFKWSFPALKMPHFSIQGKFSLNPLSVPKLGIDWYSRGGIFTKPTVLNGIGVGDASNGGGSAAEVVAPLSDLKQMLGLGEDKSTTINLNGNYSFRDKDDMDYFINQMALAARRV